MSTCGIDGALCVVYTYSMTTTDNIRNSFSAPERVLMWNVLASAAADYRKLAAHEEYSTRVREQYARQAEMADKLAAEMEASL